MSLTLRSSGELVISSDLRFRAAKEKAVVGIGRVSEEKDMERKKDKNVRHLRTPNR